MAESEKAVPLAVSLPESLIAEIDRAAADVKDSRSGVMRRAIRAGLPLVKSGGEVVRLSGELADSVGQLATHHQRSRESILLEAVQHGLEAVNVRLMIEEARGKGMDEASLAGVLRSHELDMRPEKRAAREALLAKGAVEIQLADLLDNFPAARERAQAVEKLIQLRRAAGQWPKVWGCGLSTAEIQWQIAMQERHGPDSAQWPKEEVQKRDRERAAESAARQAAAANSSPARAAVPAAQPAASKPAKRKAKHP